MRRAARRVGLITLILAGIDLALLHLLPLPLLHAATGTAVRYHLWNFLSEYVRTDYAPLMIACFVLLAVGTLSAAITLLPLRREAILLTVAGIALLLLVFFPTDLADMTTDAVTCGQITRIEPCTLSGRLHNPLSTLVFAPIFLVILSICTRSFRDTQWRSAACLAVVCGILVLADVLASYLYLHSIGWQGRLWTGLTQRSLVFPALLWMVGVIARAEGSTQENKSV